MSKVGPPVCNGRAIGLSELTPHLLCELCGGYYIDATTIVECLHTFCRSCILQHLQTTRCCPAAGCDILVRRANGAASLRPDTTLQTIVYKTVPGLHREEMRRRQQFYSDKPNADADFPPDLKGVPAEDGARFYDANDTIDVRIQYASQCPDDVVPMRYLRCPAGLPLAVLRKFFYQKYWLSENLRMELLHGSRLLPRDVTLLDVAYIVNWSREAPLELLFQLQKTSAALKRPAGVLQPALDCPAKVKKLNQIVTAASTPSLGCEAHVTQKEESSSHQLRTAASDGCADIVPSSRNGKSIGKAGIKREVSNVSSSAGGTMKTPNQEVCEKSSSTGTAPGRKINNESAKVTSATRGEAKEAKSSTVVANERIDKKRKPQTIVANRKDKTKDAASAQRPSKASKAMPFVSEQKFPSRPQTKPATLTHHADSMPTLPVDDISPSKGVRKPETVRGRPIQHLANKAKTPTVVFSKHIDTSQGRLAAGLNKKGCKPVSRDSNAQCPMKDKGQTYRQLDQAKKNPKHQVLGMKPEPAKETDIAMPGGMRHVDQKNTGSKGAATEPFKRPRPCGEGGKPLKAPLNGSTAPVNRLPAAKTDCSVQTNSVQVARAKQNQGKLTKTTSHGTNTVLSSSPRISRLQTSSSSSATTPKGSNPPAMSSGGSLGETPKAGLSQTFSPGLPKSTAAPDARGSASKTIFLFSGSKKPQNSNKIMSIVESLTQKNLLSSLAQKASRAGSTKQQVKESSGAVNNPPRGSPPATPKTTAAGTNGTFVVPSPVPPRPPAATAGRAVSSPLHIETGSLSLRYSSAVPPLSASAPASSRPVFPVLPLPQRPKSQSVRSIPNPSLVRQRSAEERARECGKGSPTAGSTAPAMSPPTISDIHSLTRQLQEAGTSVTVTDQR